MVYYIKQNTGKGWKTVAKCWCKEHAIKLYDFYREHLGMCEYKYIKGK